MHNAITIPDILLLIFPELHRSGCSRAARVCHAWSELALGVLWSQGDIHIEELFNTIPALRRAWLMCYVGPEYVAEVRRDPDRLTRSWEEAGSLSSMAVRQRRFSEIGNDGIQEIRSEDLALEFPADGFESEPLRIAWRDIERFYVYAGRITRLQLQTYHATFRRDGVNLWHRLVAEVSCILTKNDRGLDHPLTHLQSTGVAFVNDPQPDFISSALFYPLSLMAVEISFGYEHGVGIPSKHTILKQISQLSSLDALFVYGHLTDSPDDQELSQKLGRVIASQPKLTRLHYQPLPVLTTVLPSLPSLERLSMSSFDFDTATLESELPQIKNLRALQIALSTGQWGTIASSIVAKQYPALREVTLNTIDTLKHDDLAAIFDLKELSRFSVISRTGGWPVEISAAELGSLLRRAPQLRVLHLEPLEIIQTVGNEERLSNILQACASFGRNVVELHLSLITDSISAGESWDVSGLSPFEKLEYFELANSSIHERSIDLVVNLLYAILPKRCRFEISRRMNWSSKEIAAEIRTRWIRRNGAWV